jgi:hypothetical protein
MKVMTDALLVCVVSIGQVSAQTEWRPDRSVELILPTAPAEETMPWGGSCRRSCRNAESFLPVNKPGGS